MSNEIFQWSPGKRNAAITNGSASRERAFDSIPCCWICWKYDNKQWWSDLWSGTGIHGLFCPINHENWNKYTWNPKKTNGSMSNYTSPNSLNFNSNLDASLNQSSIVNSPIKDSSPESRTQSVSDIGASASQVLLPVQMDYFRFVVSGLISFLVWCWWRYSPFNSITSFWWSIWIKRKSSLDSLSAKYIKVLHQKTINLAKKPPHINP